MNTAGGWTPSDQWQRAGTTWTGTVNDEPVATLHGPDDVLSWMRQQAASLRLDLSRRSDPLFSGDRGRAVKLLASRGETVRFVFDGTSVRAVASGGSHG